MGTEGSKGEVCAVEEISFSAAQRFSNVTRLNSQTPRAKDLHINRNMYQLTCCYSVGKQIRKWCSSCADGRSCWTSSTKQCESRDAKLIDALSMQTGIDSQSVECGSQHICFLPRPDLLSCGRFSTRWTRKAQIF